MKKIHPIDTRKQGEVRIVTKFLLFPTRLGNETRWLERATIRQQLFHHLDWTTGSEWWQWHSMSFVDSCDCYCGNPKPDATDVSMCGNCGMNLD